MKPEQLHYAKTHEWASVENAGGSKLITLGITAFAVELLTDLVYIKLPEKGQKVKAGKMMAEVESVKAVSDIYSPVDGEVVEVNSKIADQLETLASDPYGAGWIAKIKVTDDAGLAQLMNYADYQKQCAEEH